MASGGSVRSTAQLGFLFANQMPFAKSWAHRSGMTGGKAGKRAYKAPPARVPRRGGRHR